MATEQVEESLRLIEDLKFFLATAPANWQENQVIRRYYLNHDEGFVSCVYWNNLYFVTGTDIVRCIVYRFEKFGRKIIDRKKFEEGIFSDLRNLKCGTDAILESPKSPFLEFLYKNNCLRTQKKQKVFFWFSVPHDKLFCDALERDLKKQSQNQESTTISESEPALSFKFDEKAALFDQLVNHLDDQKKKLATENTQTNPEYYGEIPQEHPLLNNEVSEEVYTVPDEQEVKEDDFPLDYFEDELTMDPPSHHHRGASLYENPLMTEEPNYDYIDPNIFTNPPMMGSNPLIYNDEYLIEQTQPLGGGMEFLQTDYAGDIGRINPINTSVYPPYPYNGLPGPPPGPPPGPSGGLYVQTPYQQEYMYPYMAQDYNYQMVNYGMPNYNPYMQTRRMRPTMRPTYPPRKVVKPVPRNFRRAPNVTIAVEGVDEEKEIKDGSDGLIMTPESTANSEIKPMELNLDSYIKYESNDC